jgi:hypothetical protein
VRPELQAVRSLEVAHPTRDYPRAVPLTLTRGGPERRSSILPQRDVPRSSGIAVASLVHEMSRTNRPDDCLHGGVVPWERPSRLATGLGHGAGRPPPLWEQAALARLGRPKRAPRAPSLASPTQRSGSGPVWGEGERPEPRRSAFEYRAPEAPSQQCRATDTRPGSLARSRSRPGSC